MQDLTAIDMFFDNCTHYSTHAMPQLKIKYGLMITTRTRTNFQRWALKTWKKYNNGSLSARVRVHRDSLFESRYKKVLRTDVSVTVQVYERMDAKATNVALVIVGICYYTYYTNFYPTDLEASAFQSEAPASRTMDHEWGIGPFIFVRTGFQTLQLTIRSSNY